MALQTADQVGRQEGQHPAVSRLRHEVPKARQGHAAGAALIHQRGDSGPNAAQVRVEAESSGHMFVHMSVSIDQARQHQLSAAIDAVGVGGVKVRRDRCNAFARNQHVAHFVQPGRGIDDASAAQKDVFHELWAHPRNRTVHGDKKHRPAPARQRVSAGRGFVRSKQGKIAPAEI